MSSKEMEAMDNEVMSVVNGHAAPEAVAAAEEIVERETAPRQDAPEEYQTYYKIDKKAMDEINADVETICRRKTLTIVVLCVLLAAALMVVMLKPSLLIWLVNIGVLSCAVTAGIVLDRWWHR